MAKRKSDFEKYKYYILGGAGILVLVAVLLMVFWAPSIEGTTAKAWSSAGRLRVISTPAGASVYILGSTGSATMTTPGTIQLRPGDYSVRIIKTGYADYITTARIKAGTLTQLNIALVISVCSGSINLSLSPNIVPYLTSMLVSFTASGLSNCDGKIIEFRQNNCTDYLEGSCIISGSGCGISSVIFQNHVAGRNYAACIDKNNNSQYDFGEIARAHLSSGQE